MLLVACRTDAGVALDATQEERGFVERVALSFEKNFIREDRWKLIAQGVGATCLITTPSVLFGSLLAFGVCLLRRTGSRLANLICDIYVRLLQGTPTVVLLMILYYVVFGRSGMPAVWVAILGFTPNFGAYGSEIMRSGIESINAGQREAVLALGYTERQAFFDFIFPQAAVRFLPVLRGEAVSLLKSTSVVGYIAIQDLTKMSDIIRSRTYEAFFPLIVTAIIYSELRVSDLQNLPCILIASEDQETVEADYYHDVLGFSNDFLFVRSREEGRMMVAGNRGFMPIETREQTGRAGSIVRRIPLVGQNGQLKSEYYAYWPKDWENVLIREFADILTGLFEVEK